MSRLLALGGWVGTNHAAASIPRGRCCCVTTSTSGSWFLFLQGAAAGEEVWRVRITADGVGGIGEG